MFDVAMFMHFITSSLCGGIARALLQARSFKELKRYEIVRHILLSPIAGWVYYHMVLQWNAPDTVVAFFFAYAFVDIIDRLARKIVSIVSMR